MKLILFEEKKVFLSFLQLLLISFCLGVARLLLPFQIIDLGGEGNLVSLTSVMYAVGQILGIGILSKLCEKRRSEFIVTTLLWILSLIIMSIPFLPILLTARFFEGLGYGLLLVGILNFADNNYEQNKGEVVGAVFGSIFVGTAFGQGLAGFLKELVMPFTQQLYFSAFQALTLMGILISIVPLVIAFANYDQKIKLILFKFDKIEVPHIHVKNVKKIFKFAPFMLLFLIYALYDFSHGIYTPNLALVLASHDITIFQISLIYFIGDIVFGLSQIFTGRLVDKFGSWTPIFISLVVKGFGVFGYNQFYWWFAVLLLFVLVGVGESLMEPARNVAILQIESQLKIGFFENDLSHKHKHLNISVSRGQGYVFGRHSHVHEHKLDKLSIITWLQLTGIVAFGVGGIAGSSILTFGGTSEFLIYVGATILLIASVIAMLEKIFEKKIKLF
ncbi:MAG: MFS transporter [Candidatus Odinarchaeota archaeon]